LNLWNLCNRIYGETERVVWWSK